MTRRVWMAITVIILACAFTVAAEKSAVKGRWEGKTHTGSGDATVAFNFEVKGQVLTGTADTPRGSQTIDDGKVNGNKISFNTTVNGNIVKHEGMLTGDTIQLRNTGPFGSFDLLLKRVSTSDEKPAQQ